MSSLFVIENDLELVIPLDHYEGKEKCVHDLHLKFHGLLMKKTCSD